MPNPKLPAVPPVLLPDANGNALSDNATPDGSVAMSQQGMTAQSSRYGVAYCPDGGTARAGAQGAAVVHGGLADAGDGAMAFAWSGIATATSLSTAFASQGRAQITGDAGVAVVKQGGKAQVAKTGVACALNGFTLTIVPPTGPAFNTIATDPTLGAVSGDEGSLLVAFTVDKDGTRFPVVGFIGGGSKRHNAMLNRLCKLHRLPVQTGLFPNVLYQVDPNTNQLREVPPPTATKRKARARRK